MNTGLRLVREDGSLASVQDLMDATSVVTLGGHLYKVVAVKIEGQSPPITWEAGTPEQIHEKARASLKRSIVELERATLAARGALSRLTGGVPKGD